MKKTLLYIMLFCTQITWGQDEKNLIMNGGFEKHGDAICYECYASYGKYSSVVYNWDNVTGCRLCDKTYKQHTSEKKMYDFCPFEKLSPFEGNSMIEMEYRTTGTSFGQCDHLVARTNIPMNVGHLYEVSFWLFLEKNPKADPDFPNHIGVALLPQKLLFYHVGSTKKISALTIDTVLYDKWYKVRWQVRPLCTSNYVMIGLFANQEWPKSLGFSNARYFIDNVSVYEIDLDKISTNSFVYNCGKYENESYWGINESISKCMIFFNSNNFELTQKQKILLDSFSLTAKKYPNVIFEVSGHTDSLGHENIILSEKRVQSVVSYLTEICLLPKDRFICLSIGSKMPIGPNDTEKGRSINRRVEITHSSISNNMAFYRNALNAANERNYSESFSYINKWFLTSKPDNWIIVLFDPRFNQLKHLKPWKSIEAKIKEGYQKYKFPLYAYLFDSLRMDDRRIIGELSNSLNEMTGYIPELDSSVYSLPRALTQEYVDEKQKEHFKAIIPILDQIGWPLTSAFGETSATSAFYLLQHSHDSVAFVKWLPILQKACEDGEAKWMHFAMLYDRCQLISNKPQRYATHCKVSTNGVITVENWEGDAVTINEYRAKIGLPPLPQIVVSAMKNSK